jgi:hypothetical protein
MEKERYFFYLTQGKYMVTCPLGIRKTYFLEVALKLHWLEQSIPSDTWWRKVYMTAQSVEYVPAVQFHTVAETTRYSQPMKTGTISPHATAKHENDQFPTSAKVQNVPLIIS